MFMLVSWFGLTLPLLNAADWFQIGRAVQQECRDRKSGSAGMPRPISYAVFCLKKKKKTRSEAQPAKGATDLTSVASQQDRARRWSETSPPGAQTARSLADDEHST